MDTLPADRVDATEPVCIDAATRRKRERTVDRHRYYLLCESYTYIRLGSMSAIFPLYSGEMTVKPGYDGSVVMGDSRNKWPVVYK